MEINKKRRFQLHQPQFTNSTMKVVGNYSKSSSSPSPLLISFFVFLLVVVACECGQTPRRYPNGGKIIAVVPETDPELSDKIVFIGDVVKQLLQQQQQHASTTTVRPEMTSIFVGEATENSPYLTCHNFRYYIENGLVSQYACCGRNIFFKPVQRCWLDPKNDKENNLPPPLLSSVEAIHCNGITYFVSAIYGKDYGENLSSTKVVF